MSVELDLSNIQFGNALFRYIPSRLFAEINDLKLLTTFKYDKFVTITPQVGGRIFDSPTTIICQDEGKCILNKTDVQCAKYVFYGGGWERPSYYLQYDDLIRSFVKPVVEVDKINYEDIVIHLRLGDFPIEKQIHPSWYINILNKEKFNKLYIVTDLSNIDPGGVPPGFLSFKNYLDAFSSFSPTIVGSTNYEDWNFIRSFNKILMSNGTFCWFAAFFSKAQVVYSFKKWHLSEFSGFIPVDGVLNGSI